MADPEPETSFKILRWAWQNKKWVLDKLKSLRGWFRGSPKEGDNDSEPGILIIGSGGTGKSTLGKILSGEHDLLLDPLGEYEESLTIERYSLKHNEDVQVLVPPGQAHRRPTEWPVLQADIAAGKFRGIILVCAYGYHSIGEISYTQHRLYQDDQDAFLRSYLEDRRKDELAVLNQLSPQIQVSPTKMWLLTLVTKQDLWCNENQEVEAYYRDGKYGKAISKLLENTDLKSFRHEIAFSSLVISNFVTGRDERLQDNTAGYDHARCSQSLRRLLEIVDALKSWEQS